MAYLGKSLVGIGLIFSAVGLIIWLLGDKLSWLGHLPGDFKWERRGLFVYVPLTSMLLASLAFSVILWIIKRFLK